jgi:hypothetical protein
MRIRNTRSPSPEWQSPLNPPAQPPRVPTGTASRPPAAVFSHQLIPGEVQIFQHHTVAVRSSDQIASISIDSVSLFRDL